MNKWKQSMDFISDWEKKFQNDEITLQDMAKGIYNAFITQGWFDPEYKKEIKKSGISDEGIYDLEELIDGELHTIAFMNEIFEEGEELLDVEDYDYWKYKIYNWADAHRVWIKPSI